MPIKPLTAAKYDEILEQAIARSIARVAAFEHKYEVEGKSTEECITQMMRS